MLLNVINLYQNDTGEEAIGKKCFHLKCSYSEARKIAPIGEDNVPELVMEIKATEFSKEDLVEVDMDKELGADLNKAILKKTSEVLKNKVEEASKITEMQKGDLGIGDKLFKVSDNIYKSCFRGIGNVVITNAKTLGALKDSPGFTAYGFGDIAGDFNKRWPVLTIETEELNDFLLVGYVGDSFLDRGVATAIYKTRRRAERVNGNNMEFVVSVEFFLKILNLDQFHGIKLV